MPNAGDRRRLRDVNAAEGDLVGVTVQLFNDPLHILTRAAPGGGKVEDGPLPLGFVCVIEETGHLMGLCQVRDRHGRLLTISIPIQIIVTICVKKKAKRQVATFSVCSKPM